MQGKKLTHIIVGGIECKPCSRCSEILPIGDYSNSKITSDGHRSACKKCERLESIRNYAKNVERDIARARAWQAANPEKVREIDRQRNNENRKAWRKDWEKQNPEKVKKYARKSYENQKTSGNLAKYQKAWLSIPKNAIDHRMTVMTRKTLKGEKAGRRWSDLLGYTISDLMTRLSETMPQNYSWERLGEMHIDHIIPKALFQYESEDDQKFKECWALSNLQLLPAIENLTKSKKLIKTGGYHGF